ncbi:MAG TPA: pimeloyl-[acyl-carrier protein] methyl ester esterase, partial [Tahibacter sp.]|nr:pimeloyl-[acyl-carrier protein] methyl ester esterase [Tahibacter sp.]
EALGSDHAKAELRTLKAHVFERGEPSLAVLCDGLDVLDRTDLRARLPELAMPSAWIAGRRDRLIPAAAMQWAAHAAHGRYVETPAGHAPFIAHAGLVADALVALDTESPA